MQKLISQQNKEKDEIDPLEKAFLMGKYIVGLVIISLSVLFAATLVGLAAAYINPNNPRASDTSEFPIGFFISTFVIMLSAVTIYKAVKASVKSDISDLKSRIIQTMGLGYVFLFVQVWNWYQLYQLQITPYSQDLYAFSIYILTVLHALHVIGGLIPLTMLSLRVSKCEMSNSISNSVHYLAVYWHFLGVVWCVIVVVLWFAK